MTEFEQQVTEALKAWLLGPIGEPIAQSSARILAPAVAAAIDAVVDQLVDCERSFSEEMLGSPSPDTRPDGRLIALTALRGA